MTVPPITIAGVRLTDEQALCVRVDLFMSKLANQRFAASLGPIADGYREQLRAVERLLVAA